MGSNGWSVQCCHVCHTIFNVCGYLNTHAGPLIVEFPGDVVRVVEGERVEFMIKVMGVAEPQLRWYHDGEEVMASYSTDLGQDGSLTISCSEYSHSGVYQLVATNHFGRTEREVKLFVRRQEQSHARLDSSKVPMSPVPVLDFTEHVACCHANDNSTFQEQFKVGVIPVISV